MKVQFTTPMSGRELNEVADLDESDARFLLAGGHVRVPGKDTSQDQPDGTDNLAVVRAQDVHTEEVEDEDEREVDLEERADARSGKGDQPIPEDVLNGDHPFEGEPVNPFEDTSESNEGGLEGMSARELKSFIERINADDENANLQPIGNKSQLQARIREYQARKQAENEQA